MDFVQAEQQGLTGQFIQREFSITFANCLSCNVQEVLDGVEDLYDKNLHDDDDFQRTLVPLTHPIPHLLNNFTCTPSNPASRKFVIGEHLNHTVYPILSGTSNFLSIKLVSIEGVVMFQKHLCCCYIEMLWKKSVTKNINREKKIFSNHKNK